jgi:sigma-B regulation protein RsbU (phosphoserine phosphatase)
MEMPSPFRLNNKRGILDPDTDHYTLGSAESIFDLATSPNFSKALHGPVVDSKPYSDRFGTWFSAYAPFYRSDGTVAGVVEVGMDLHQLREEEKSLRYLAFSVLGVAFLLTVLLAAIIASWVTRPIRELVAGTQLISLGDLRTPVHCDSDDEFGDLAESFNDMCSKLDVAQRDLIEKERFQQEMELASRIQLSMLPQVPPPLATLDIAFHFQPLDEVGGDYYDLLPLADEKLGIAIGDVAGHGIGAALLMSMAKSSLHTQASRGSEVLEVMASINDMVYSALKERKFMTFFYSVLDIRALTLTYANAGHHYPYHLDENSGQLSSLVPSVYPLGVRQNVDFPVRQIQLSPGDILIYYSDGMTESKNPEGEEFGFERLEQAILEFKALSAEAIRDGILRRLAAFCLDQRAEDDQTILIVKVRN